MQENTDMAKYTNVMIILGAFMAVFLQSVAAQTTVHIVGDGAGWVIPQGGAAFYYNWAASKEFVVGDILSKYISLCFSPLYLFIFWDYRII